MEGLGLSPWLIASCNEMGLRKPTPIQAACIGPTLNGRDVVGSAETGSGKTAAFALPVLQALSKDPYGIFALVLSPARELAYQIADQFTALGAPLRVRVSVIVGGADMMHQGLELAQRPHVVVATPGRFADHLRSSSIACAVSKLRFVVIDEADRLLELGFNKDLQFILSHLPRKRQTLLFSATMSGALESLQSSALRAPFIADLAPKERVVDTLTQQYVFMPAAVRDCYLVYLLRKACEAESTVIVFTSTCRSCELLAAMLLGLDITCAPLHSQQPQRRRAAAVAKLKQGSLSVLIATDVAARGLDIPAVDLVINHNVPAAPSDYIHRCGRTARAGRTGRALTLVTQYDVDVLLAIEDHVGTKLAACEPPEQDVLRLLNEVASARREALLALTENGFLEKEKERRAKKAAEAKEVCAGDTQSENSGVEPGVGEDEVDQGVSGDSPGLVSADMAQNDAIQHRIHAAGNQEIAMKKKRKLVGHSMEVLETTPTRGRIVARTSSDGSKSVRSNTGTRKPKKRSSLELHK